MAAGVDGAYAVVVGVAGKNVGVVERRTNDGLVAGDALQGGLVFAPVDLVAGEIGLRVGLPAQVDGGRSSRCRIGRGRHGSEFYRDGGREYIECFDADRRG